MLSKEEIKSILNLPDIGTPDGLRNRVMMELLYACGLRRGELASLTVSDVAFSRQVIVVREGKGGKDRVLPLGDRCSQWIRTYLEDSRSELLSPHSGDYLFITDYGEPFIATRIGAMVKRYLVRAQIDKPGCCHLFRHSMATHMLDNGADVRFIQALLGHAQLSTTEIYTHVSIEKLREIYTATHPAENRAGQVK